MAPGEVFDLWELYLSAHGKNRGEGGRVMANREIKTKVAIDGEKEYKESLKNINSALGTLKSELKLVESQYAGQANSYAALSAKGDVLSRMYDQQKEKVKAAAEQLEKAKKAQSDYAEKVSLRAIRDFAL